MSTKENGKGRTMTDTPPVILTAVLARVAELEKVYEAAKALLATYEHHPEGDWFVKDDNFDATDNALEALHAAVTKAT